ncbi:MAG: glutamate--tRNA ligase [Bacilli bacterium]|nr:glutamate--tRNA ligase [Bacilli bacterium]
MTNKDLANLIFPDIKLTVDDYKKMYPKRNVGAVTRFAPSPTGYVHIGGIYQAIIDFLIAKNNNGVFMLRIEDTDQKREVKEAVDLIKEALEYYGLTADEYELDGKTVGSYGPYVQSERKEIYHAFIKYLVEIGRAYPCFCTKETLDELRVMQEQKKQRTGYYGKYAKCRNLSVEEMIEKVKNGEAYVMRFRSEGDFERKFKFHDEVKGDLELSENDEDLVIMKSDNLLPTYHFAHVVDDFLMGTTHIVRGEEWLSSAPKHVELFNAFGFGDLTYTYVHTPLIIKKEGNSIRKISKRKDPEASMSYYSELGYPAVAVIESLMTIINSNYEEWHTANPDKSFVDFEYNPQKMSSSGALYDLEKLNNISKEFISKMKATDLCDEAYKWASKYSESLKELIDRDKEYFTSILNIEREQEKPRKDIVNYSMIENLIWYMFDDKFDSMDKEYEWKNITDLDEIKNILNVYIDKYYDINDDKETWFNKVKLLCDELGYASNIKEYKADPSKFKGNVADVSTVIRVALTSKSNTPDLYEIMKLFGKDRILSRIEKLK